MVSDIKQPKHLPLYVAPYLVKHPKISRGAIIFIIVSDIKQPKHLPWHAVPYPIKHPKKSHLAPSFPQWSMILNNLNIDLGMLSQGSAILVQNAAG